MKKKTWALSALVVLTVVSIAFAGYIEDRADRIWKGIQMFTQSSPFVFEGATDDAYETTVAITDPTADRTITIPDKSGTIEFANAKLQEDVTAANVITVAECGTTYFLNSETEFQSTLPAVSTVSAGCEFKFIVKAAPSGADYTIISGNTKENVITGGVVERETDSTEDGPYQADGDTITFESGVAVAGDYIELISDGSKYYLHGQVNADGAVTLAQN